MNNTKGVFLMKTIRTKLTSMILTAAFAVSFAPLAFTSNSVRADGFNQQTYDAVVNYYDSASAFLSMHYDEVPADVYLALDTARSNAFFAIQSKTGLDQAYSDLRVQLEVAEATLAGIPIDTNQAPDYVVGTAGYNATYPVPVSGVTAQNVAAIYANNRNLPAQMIRVLVVDNYIDRLYMSVFGRNPGSAEEAVWVQNLMVENMTGSQIASAMLNSSEFTSRNLTNQQFVTVLYRTFLDREPDPTGLANWTNALNNGTSRQQLIDTFASLSQWGDICSYYGIAK